MYDLSEIRQGKVVVEGQNHDLWFYNRHKNSLQIEDKETFGW